MSVTAFVLGGLRPTPLTLGRTYGNLPSLPGHSSPLGICLGPGRTLSPYYYSCFLHQVCSLPRPTDLHSQIQGCPTLALSHQRATCLKMCDKIKLKQAKQHEGTSRNNYGVKEHLSAGPPAYILFHDFNIWTPLQISLQASGLSPPLSSCLTH